MGRVGYYDNAILLLKKFKNTTIRVVKKRHQRYPTKNDLNILMSLI